MDTVLGLIVVTILALPFMAMLALPGSAYRSRTGKGIPWSVLLSGWGLYLIYLEGGALVLVTALCAIALSIYCLLQFSGWRAKQKNKKT